MRWNSFILYAVTFCFLLVCCRNLNNERLQGEVICTIIASGDNLPRCEFEIWHQLLFVNNTSNSICWSTGIKPDSCLGETKMNPRLVINNVNLDEETLNKMKILYHDSLVFNLVIRGERDRECVAPYDSASIELGMYNRYDKALIELL